jgi:predicted PurR-regulated permease PerM
MFRLRRSDDVREYSVTISNETFVRLALLTVGFIFLIFSVRKAAHALILIFGAFFLTLALNGPVYWLSKRIPGKRKGSRSLATTLSFLIVIVLLGLFIASVVPPLVHQTGKLINAAPNLVRDLRDQNSPVGHIIRKYHMQKEIGNFSTQLADRLKNSGGTALSSLQKVATSAFSLLVILVLTFMMLVEGPRWVAFTKDVIPDRHHKLADRMSNEMYQVVKGYVNGQVVLALLASLLIIPMVYILGIGYLAAILVVIFICGLIPLVGHTMGAVIVTTIALFHSTSAAIIILAYYILYQQIETYLIQPKIQANSTNMSPLLVFSSVIVGVSFGGLFGGLVAIPVAGCLRIAILEYLRTHGIISSPDFTKDITAPGTK